MSDNTAVIGRIYNALGNGDVPTVVAAMDPAIEWNEAEGFPYSDHNPYIGPDAVVEGVLGRLGSEWDGFTVNVERLLDAGDSVIALGRYTATHGTTGIPLDAQFAHVWDLRDGRAVRFQQYTDTLQASTASGA
jgi:hypothetical protein